MVILKNSEGRENGELTVAGQMAFNLARRPLPV
jgi:hypothetical protein